MLYLTDSHCHLEQVPDPDSAVARAAEVGVTTIMAVAEDAASGQAVLELRQRFPGQVKAAIGLHPCHTPSLTDEQLAQELVFVKENLAAADQLGEVGLDFKYADSDKEQQRQRRFLGQQLTLAAEAGKSINLHSRRAQRQTMEVAIDYTKRTGLGAQLHWFTQSKKLIRLCNQAGVYVSVGPSLLGSEQACQVAAVIERDLLLLETDSPVPFDGESARPFWVRRVAEKVAELWGCDLEEVALRTQANFARLLGESPAAPSRDPSPDPLPF